MVVYGLINDGSSRCYGQLSMTDQHWTRYVRAWREVGLEFYLWGVMRLGAEWKGKRGMPVRGGWHWW